MVDDNTTADVEQRLERVALDGLVNIYHHLTGQRCSRHLALGMATAAVAALDRANAAHKSALQELCTAVDPVGGDGELASELLPQYVAAIRAGAEALLQLQMPIAMVLHCPVCHFQHIDAPDLAGGWTNPPHRSHKCGRCGTLPNIRSPDNRCREN